MAFVLSDRIKETTTTTSTGTYTLGGAVSGFETFTANLSNGDTTYYCCTDGTDFEVGLGTFASSGTTLARTTIISSSNSNNAVNWSSGSRDIFCTLPGSKAIAKNGDGDITLADDEEIKLGADGDLRIFHDGSNSLIQDNGTGSLILKANPLFHVEKTGTSELMIKTTADGAVKLYHDNSEKLETESTGVKVTGNLEAEGGYIGFGTISTDNWGKIEFLGTDPNGFSSQFDNAVAIVNEQGSTNQRIFVFDTSLDNSGDLFGVSAQGQAVFSVLGTGNLKFKRPNGNTTHDITLACSTPSAARTVTLPDATGTVSLITATETLTNKTLTSPKINEDVAVTATATEINKLDGVTATTTELNYVDVTTLGTVEASKAVTADANGDVKFSDDDALRFGTGSDLRIFHDGANNIFRGDSNPMFIQTDNTIFLTKNNNAESMAKFIGDGAVELYHNNVKKVETTSDGATVTGNLELLSTDAGASSAPLIELYRHSASPAADDFLGRIDFYGEDDNDDKVRYASITSSIFHPTNGNERGRLELDLMQNGSMVTFIELVANGINLNKPLFITGDTLITNGDADADADPTLTLRRTSASPAFNDQLGELVFTGRSLLKKDCSVPMQIYFDFSL